MNALDVLVKYAVSEKSEENAWADLVKVCVEAYASGQDVAEFLGTVEAEFKEKTNSTQCPSRYRSAKSVVLGAYNNKVELLSENGEPMGKTAVERLIKAAKTKVKAEPSDMVEDALNKMRKAYLACDNEAERIALKAYIEANIHSVWG